MTEPLAFSLDWLAEAGARRNPLTVCAAGHLVVRQRSHWRPVAFSPDMKKIVCAPVESCER